MLIKNLFKRNISRSIKGVVVADQLDESTVWQELDEFVVTQELDKHFRRFFSSYLEAIDNPKDVDISGKIGVWISGFFGSGKSHFIKILSHLLDNEEHGHDGETKRAVDFFESKIQDAMLYGDIKRAVASKTDVILFNIDSKADAGTGRDAILSVFLKVLNEMQGFSPDHPHIAHMERYLDSRGKLEAFRTEFETATGSSWLEERDAYEFRRDEVIDALAATLEQSKDSCEKWIDNAEENFSLTVENFCKWVKEYLDAQGPDHRIIFLVDEVGQFIGGDTHLMLNLQTITEDLGTACGGRAWVVVTSQEDIDAVLGDLRTTKSHDFSKIQGRFKTRLSLSSANVDEVIQERLLAKDDGVSTQLEDIFREKGDILRNQLSFRDVGMTFKQYRDSDDFVRNYPFAPYQFQLVQKIFEAIRKAGATGLHLSRGERSILDAFQSAGKAIAEQETGVLVPLYLFYPSIESFLDTAVKKTIDQAADNASLKPFDVEILRVLFLIRYVDEVKGNVDNLVTLCIDQIDADRLAIKKQIEESLVRLEKETLINRSGDNYFFLTNEERDINREIKSVELSSTEEAKLLGEIIFDDALKGSRKYRYPANKMDFSFNRMCDGFPYGSRVDKDLTVQVYTPLGETDTELFENSRFQRESSQNEGQVVIKIDDDPSLGRELRQYLQTDKYLRSKSDDTLPETTKRIHRAMAEDNRVRRDRLKNLLSDLMSDATYFAAGQKVEVKSSTPQTALDEALEYLVDNSFSKMDHITRLSDEPKQELQAIIRANDIQKAAMEGVNEKALEDLRGYIHLCHQTSRPIVLFELVERFEKRPYGWPDMETLILLARLLVLGEIHFVTNGAPLQLDKVYENITAPRKQRSITVIRRKTTDPKVLQDARKLGKEVFGETGPDSEDGLFEFLKGKCHAWKSSLSNYKTLADTGNYPGREKIDDGSDLLANLLAADEPAKMIERFLENKDDCVDLAEDFHVIDNFYSKQKPTWEKLRKSAQRLNLNRFELDADESARKALDRMEQILKAPSPYGILQEADGLISTAEAVNRQIVDQRRQSALSHINELHSQVLAELESAGADDRLKANSTGPLEDLRDNVATQESVAHIAQAVQRAEEARDTGLKLIDEFVAKKAAESTGGSESPKPVIKPRCEIRPSALVAKTYLETRDDADAFIDKLKSEIVAAIAAGKRVQIR